MWWYKFYQSVYKRQKFVEETNFDVDAVRGYSYIIIKRNLFYFYFYYHRFYFSETQLLYTRKNCGRNILIVTGRKNIAMFWTCYTTLLLAANNNW